MKNKQWLLKEPFHQVIDHLKWHEEPKEWFIEEEGSKLVLFTDENTDFWQNTHYGFQRDDGHFLYFETDENFRMATKVTVIPNNQYDQAGLMLRFDKNNWVKTSLEYIPSGLSKLGAVVTNQGYSDWSTQFVEIGEDIEVYYRLSKIQKNMYIDFSWDRKDWQQIRIAHLDIPEKEKVKIGIYACSPQGKDQKVIFSEFQIEKLGNHPEIAYL